MEDAVVCAMPSPRHAHAAGAAQAASSGAEPRSLAEGWQRGADSPLCVAAATAAVIALILVTTKPLFVAQRRDPSRLSGWRLASWVLIPSALVLWCDQVRTVHGMIIKPIGGGLCSVVRRVAIG